MKHLVLLLFGILGGCSDNAADYIPIHIEYGQSIKHCNVDRDLSGKYFIHDCAFGGTMIGVSQ